MSNEKAFVWAQGEQANVIEPLAYLKENGWRYGDTPMASNVNWLFKMLTEDLASFRKDILTIKDEIGQLRKDTKDELHAVKTDIGSLREQTAKDLETIKKSTMVEFSNVRKEMATSNEKLSSDIASLKESTTKETSAIKKELSAVREEIERVTVHAENEIAKVLEKTAATFAEVRLEAAQTKEKTNEALRRTVGHNYALIQLGFVGRKICQHLRAMEQDLKKLLPNYPGREWPADENLSAVPREEDSDG